MWIRIVVSLMAAALLAGCASAESRAEQLCVQSARALASDDPQRSGMSLRAVQGLLWGSDRLVARGFDTDLADQTSARCPYEFGAALLLIADADPDVTTARDVYRPYIDAMRTAAPDPTLLDSAGDDADDADGALAGLSGFAWAFAGLMAVMLALRGFEVAVRAPARRRRAYWEAEAEIAREAREAREAAEAAEALDTGEGDDAECRARDDAGASAVHDPGIGYDGADIGSGDADLGSDGAASAADDAGDADLGSGDAGRGSDDADPRPGGTGRQ